MASLVTRIRYRGNCPVTVHESRVTSVQKRMEPRRSLLGASVDQTDARKRAGRPSEKSILLRRVREER